MDVVDLCSSGDEEDEVEFVCSRRVERKRKRQVPEMRRGSRAASCLNDVDQKFENLSANDRSVLLLALFASSRKALNKWRIEREKRGSTTLWGLVEACWEKGFEVRASDDRGCSELPGRLEHGRAGDVTTKSAMKYMARRLAALRDSVSFDISLSQTSGEGDFSCCLCMDDFVAEDLVFCGGDEMHAACRPCFNGLCTKFAADKGVGSAAVACPSPGCSALFSRRDVVSCVSPIDIMKMDERERDSSVKTGLGGSETLRCVCGTVGSFAKEQGRRDAVVDCPTCSRRYCLECGHLDHRPSPCPLPQDGTDAWIAKKTKSCPKCNEAIEKNAGCAHMTCRCGHQFCWICLGPFPHCHCGHFEDESRREAIRLQLADFAAASSAHATFHPPMPPHRPLLHRRRNLHTRPTFTRQERGRRRSRRLSDEE